MKALIDTEKLFNETQSLPTLLSLLCCLALGVLVGCSVASNQSVAIPLSRCSELLYAAQDALEKEKFYESEFYSLKCLEEDPANASALDMLGLSYLKRGSYERAKFYFDAIQNVDPSYDYLHHRLSLVNFSLENFEECRKHFWIAYDLYPVDPQTQALKKFLEEEDLID